MNRTSASRKLLRQKLHMYNAMCHTKCINRQFLLETGFHRNYLPSISVPFSTPPDSLAHFQVPLSSFSIFFSFVRYHSAAMHNSKMVEN